MAEIKMGTGFERIKEMCKKENAPFPEIEFNENYFYVTFKQSHEYLRIAKAIPETVEKTVEKVLALIRENPRITMKELCQEPWTEVHGVKRRAVLEHSQKSANWAGFLKSKKITLTRRGVEWNISKLKKEGKIQRIGGKKGGYWKVL